jgi:hypothetical protein
MTRVDESDPARKVLCAKPGGPGDKQKKRQSRVKVL